MKEVLDKGFASKVFIISFLMLIFFSFGLKVDNLELGSPYVTIDDNTMYEAGFLVWFGQAPPQRTYLESWVAGLSSLSTYAYQALTSGEGLGVNLIADAYRDFYYNPAQYVYSYRVVMLCIDLITVLFVFLLARKLLGNSIKWVPYFVAALYGLSYNTVWSNVVARPDTLTAFFSTLGLLLYYHSKFGVNKREFYLAALCFGVATGVKLHAAFFVIFIFIDCLRLNGFSRKNLSLLPFGTISVVSFLIAAGSPLFDPLTYIKLRLLNVKDDASPWIEWGEQFQVILEGTGWFTIPAILLFFMHFLLKKKCDKTSPVLSLLLIGICWLVLFSMIRQMRAYWMLPALPVFYILLGYALSQIKFSVWRNISVLIFSSIFTVQTFSQHRELQEINYSEVTEWINENISQDEMFFVTGFDSLQLPLSPENIENRRAKLINKTLLAGRFESSFTYRYVQFWEERSALMLLDMLGEPLDKGFNYFSYFSTPQEEYKDVYSLDKMNYIFVQEHSVLSGDSSFKELLSSQFVFVDEMRGAGGGGTGLMYNVYRRQ